MLEAWMRKYKPEELFDQDGRLIRRACGVSPDRKPSQGANPSVNGGRLLKANDLRRISQDTRWQFRVGAGGRGGTAQTGRISARCHV